MTDLRYKNTFITQTFCEIDQRRAELNMETVLPLSYSERKSFFELTTIKLTRHELKLVLGKSIFLIVSTVHLCGILLADYAVFWLLSIIAYHGNQNTGTESEGERKRRNKTKQN